MKQSSAQLQHKGLKNGLPTKNRKVVRQPPHPPGFTCPVTNNIPYGLEVRILGFHPRGPGAVPGMGKRNGSVAHVPH